MDTIFYEKPLRIELVGQNLFVNGNQHPRTARLLSQMSKVVQQYDTKYANLEMYYMYRNVYKEEDIRFDITIIQPWEVHGECAKTLGHYHPKSEEGLAYPEIYQVLKGKAVFILQKKNRNGSVDVIIIRAKEKETVVFPPGYGHVSVNPGPEELVLSNLVYDKFESIYAEYENNKGAAYYYMKDGSIEQNTNYVVQNTEHLTSQEINSRYGFECSDMLVEFLSDKKRFEFLKKPSLKFKI